MFCLRVNPPWSVDSHSPIMALFTTLHRSVALQATVELICSSDGLLPHGRLRNDLLGHAVVFVQPATVMQGQNGHVLHQRFGVHIWMRSHESTLETDGFEGWLPPEVVSASGCHCNLFKHISFVPGTKAPHVTMAITWGWGQSAQNLLTTTHSCKRLQHLFIDLTSLPNHHRAFAVKSRTSASISFSPPWGPGTSRPPGHCSCLKDSSPPVTKGIEHHYSSEHDSEHQ